MQQVVANWVGADKDFWVSMTDAPVVNVTADAPRSTDLVLAGLVTCSGRTLLTILGRMRLAIAGLKVWATCERETEPPKVFTHIDLYFEVWLGQTAADRVEHALALSEKHCTVYNILKQAAPIQIHHRLHAGAAGGE